VLGGWRWGLFLLNGSTVLPLTSGANTNMQTTRSTRTRKLIVGAGLALGTLTMATGAASAFPNGPVVISDDPVPPPPPPQPPADIADAPDEPDQPWQGPDGFAIPEPGPAQPIPGPDGGNGNGGGQQGDESSEQAVAHGPSAEELAAIAGLIDAEAAQAATADEVQPDGTVGKESDRPATGDDDTTELAAGELAADQAQSGPWALFAALAAMALAGIAGLILFLARRRTDEQEATVQA
jgi:hypothetical protein